MKFEKIKKKIMCIQAGSCMKNKNIKCLLVVRDIHICAIKIYYIMNKFS